MNDRRMIPTLAKRRRGSTYVVVLGGAMAISVIGLSALLATRVQRRFSEETADLTQARILARSAIELGFHRIGADNDWRNTYAAGTWIVGEPLGGGSFSLAGVDPVDADLTDDETEPLLFTATGVKGPATYNLSVTLNAVIEPLGCLEVSVSADNDITFNGATARSDQIISGNNNVTANSSAVQANVEAAGSISGGTYTGTTTAGTSPRSMPDMATVFDYYITNGTPIAPVTIPNQRIEKVVISPASNPFGGPTNPQGIYVIDCKGGSLVIRDTRIVGTLVLLEPGSSSQVQGSVNWQPAVANFPALLVRGTLPLLPSQSPLAEASTGINFNPAGTPYLGNTDVDIADVYPSIVSGLIYQSQDLTIPGGAYATLNGVLVVGGNLTVQVSATIDVTYQRTFFDNPPPGFTEPPKMVIAPGSWTHVVN